jgi:hypothetical protein
MVPAENLFRKLSAPTQELCMAKNCVFRREDVNKSEKGFPSPNRTESLFTMFTNILAQNGVLGR